MKRLSKIILVVVGGIVMYTVLLMAVARGLDAPVAYVSEQGICDYAEVVEDGRLVTLDDCPADWRSFQQVPVASEDLRYRIETGLIEQPGVY